MKRVWLYFICVFYMGFQGVFADEINSLPEPYCHLKTLYSFDSFGWFNEQKQAVLKKLILENKVKVVIEVGSFLGKSTRFIAQNLPANGKLYAVDHWKGNLEHQTPQREDVYPKLATLYDRFLSNIIHAKLCDIVIPIKASSLEAAKIIQETPDLIFIDASHEYEDVLADLQIWYPKIKKGGILCGDDWLWGGDKLPVQQAVKDFAAKRKLTYKAKGAIWWIHI